MADIDAFATSLLDQAKRFYEKASSENVVEAKSAYLHAALLLGFCSFEAHINAIAEDFIDRPDLSCHERGIVFEKEVRLENGDFVLGGLRMYRMEDRILFLHRRFSGVPIDKSAKWWSGLNNAIDLRNKLSHPKQAHAITISSVENALRSIIAAIDVLYAAIYKSKFPDVNLGLQSKLSF
jgi:hypothetical protein